MLNEGKKIRHTKSRAQTTYTTDVDVVFTINREFIPKADVFVYKLTVHNKKELLFQ